MRNLLDKTPKRYVEGLKSELRNLFGARTIQDARRVKELIYKEYAEVAGETVELLDEGFEDAMVIIASTLCEIVKEGPSSWTAPSFTFI